MKDLLNYEPPFIKELNKIHKKYKEKQKKKFFKDKAPFKFNPKKLGDYDAAEKCVRLEKFYNNKAIRNKLWVLLEKAEAEASAKTFCLMMFGTDNPEKISKKLEDSLNSDFKEKLYEDIRNLGLKIEDKENS